MVRDSNDGLMAAMRDTDRRVAVLLILLTVVAVVELVVMFWLAWQLGTLNDQLDRECGPGGTVSRLDLTGWVRICQGHGQ